MSDEHLQRYATKTEMARSLGVDTRSLSNKLKPVALLVSAGKTIPLYYWSDQMLSSLSVNAHSSSSPLSHAEL
jgi:hypothetical protein